MHVKNLPQIFRDCCSTDNKLSIAEPFLINGVVYATDGRVIVRKPAPKAKRLIGGATGNLPMVTPTTFGLWNHVFTDPIDIPKIPKAKYDADGEERTVVTAFGKTRLANKYLRIIRKHGGKLRLRADEDPRNVVAFVGDGWDGLLMQCDPKDEP